MLIASVGSKMRRSGGKSGLGWDETEGHLVASICARLSIRCAAQKHRCNHRPDCWQPPDLEAFPTPGSNTSGTPKDKPKDKSRKRQQNKKQPSAVSTLLHTHTHVTRDGSDYGQIFSQHSARLPPRLGERMFRCIASNYTRNTSPKIAPARKTTRKGPH